LNRQNIIKKLLSIEARSRATAQECYELRELIQQEESVSTHSEGRQGGLTEAQLSEFSAKRFKRIFKNAAK